MPKLDVPASLATRDLVLEPVLDARFALGYRHVGLCLLAGLFFLYLGYLPLWPGEIWGQVLYGRTILATHQLPVEDPLQPLAEGVPICDSSWLSQVIFAAVEQKFGAEGLSTLFAATVLATYLVLGRLLYLRSRQLAATLVGLALALALAWTTLPIVGPQIFGLLAMVVLLWLLAATDAPGPSFPGGWPPLGVAPRVGAGWVWIGVPLVMALWANLHASFVCGLAILGCRLAAEAYDAARSAGDWRAAFWSAQSWRWLLLFQAGLVATLVNPYGIDLWLDTTVFGRAENLAELAPWQALDTGTPLGVAFLACWGIGVVLLRRSRAPMVAQDAISLGVFTLATLASVRMAAWLGPVLAVAFAPLLAERIRSWRRRSASRSAVEPAGDLGVFTEAAPERTTLDWTALGPSTATEQTHDRRPAEPGAGGSDPAGQSAWSSRSSAVNWRPTLLAGLVLWICFAFSGAGRLLLGGKPRGDQQLYGAFTPWRLTDYLREHPTRGQAFGPHYWGDWLAWRGPESLRPFAASRVEALPQRVWRDYLAISEARSGWERLLDRYRVTTMIVDKKGQALLASLMKRAEGWKLSYEDDATMLLTRHDFVPPALLEFEPACDGGVTARVHKAAVAPGLESRSGKDFRTF